MKKIALLALFMLSSSLAFSNENTTQYSDISGKWKTIDDQTGFSRGDVLVTKNSDGTFSGKIIAIRPLPGKPLVSVCLKCKGDLKDAPFVGLRVISNFKQDPDKPLEYTNGRMLDPLSGNVYNGKARMSSNGKRLILRGYIGVSMLGRNQSWVRIAD